MNRIIAAIALSAATLALAAGCGASAATSRSSPHTAAPVAAPMVTDPSGQVCSYLDGQGYCPGDDPPSCTSQLQRWLSTDTSGDQLVTNGQAMTNVMVDAANYWQFRNTPAAGDLLTNGVGAEVGFLSGSGNMPSCADQIGTYSVWVQDATSLGNDVPGSSDAASDYQQLQTDWSFLKSEITNNGGTP